MRPATKSTGVWFARPIPIFALAFLSCLASQLPGAAAPRDAVVRVEAAIDPVSAGPAFAADLSARQVWSPYEAEIARRLRIGSAGTGFFVNSDGYLVTNAHVVLGGVRYRGLHFTGEQWDSLTLLLSLIRDIWVTAGEGEDERSYVAEPVAISEELDLAVLRVIRPPCDRTSFGYLPLANSDGVRLGDGVSALGFPEDGFQESSGHVLSLISGREVHERMSIVRRTDPLTGREVVTVSGTSPGPVVRLHHDAPVGHGSSGGPILDADGRVIGVAYALIAERNPDLDEESLGPGLNLAIASNVLKRFLSGQSVGFTEETP
ncbi:MAG: S1C family serine protease [Armatimonadota bacterium]